MTAIGKSVSITMGILAAVSLSFMVGVSSVPEKKPCLKNLKDIWLWDLLQDMLNNPDEVIGDDETAMTKGEMVQAVVDGIDGKPGAGSIYVWQVGDTSIKYYVPSLCYVEEGFTGPVLWMKQ